MPSVSVAMCTYNGARFVAEQVDSILRQSVVPDELVVADDGSTDGTLGIVRERLAAAGAAAPRLVVLEPGPAPLGVTANFERALAAATGDLVALSDQDDVWHPERIERQAARFEGDPGLLALHSDARLVDGDGRPLGATLFQALRYTEHDREVVAAGRALDLIIRRNLATGATMMIRRRLLDLARPFPPSPGPRDWVHDEWLSTIAAVHGGFGSDPAQLVDYRLHGANQIGIVRQTFGHRVRKVFEPRGDQYEALAERARLLADRLTGSGAPPAAIALAEEKARFDAARAALPASRLARLRPVWRLWRAGAFRRLASQGDIDVVRSLLQPV